MEGETRLIGTGGIGGLSGSDVVQVVSGSTQRRTTHTESAETEVMALTPSSHCTKVRVAIVIADISLHNLSDYSAAHSIFSVLNIKSNEEEG